ncbi:MAG TPA: PIN domain-containing protein [Nitriliruptorales bacterium]
MSLVLDSSGVLAALEPNERAHVACRDALASATPPLLLSPFVLAELDYLFLSRRGIDAELALLGEVARGAYRLEPMTSADVGRAREIAEQYRDLRLGIADASVLVLCERYDTHDVLTLDHRHFRSITDHGQPLRLLPDDL